MAETDEEKLKSIMLEPPFRDDQLPIIVKRFFTDVNGTIVDKATVPAALQVDYPVYIFGEFDRQGAYLLADKNNPPLPGTFFLSTMVVGGAGSLPQSIIYTGVADILGQLKPGDIVNIYTDNVQAPTYFIWIVLHCPNKSLASIMANMPNLPPDENYGYIRSKSFRFYCSNAEQWNVNIQYIRYNFMGLVKSDNLDPSIYQLPKLPVLDMVEVKWKSPITQYIGLNTYILFATDSFTLNFNIQTRKNDFDKIQ